MNIKTKEQLKKILINAPVFDRYFYAGKLYNNYNKINSVDKNVFIKRNWKKIKIVRKKNNKSIQIEKLLQNVDIVPIKNNSFFYSIDCFKCLRLKNHIIDNYSIDYGKVVYSSFASLVKILDNKNDEFSQDEIKIINSFRKYYERIRTQVENREENKKQINAIKSLFERPADSFFEGLQRILFINQFLWQTGHKHNGLGHLDWIMYPLYKQDIDREIINYEKAKKMIEDFFKALHEYCWFKSAMLPGDTGQIIVLGGNKNDNGYEENELTYLFIEVAAVLKLPDPKILLRCSSKMPDSLLKSALSCIATGIGSPLLSNDDVIIPGLVQFGYSSNDAFSYNTAACWEPLITGNSSDYSNIYTFNFAKPLVDFFNKPDFIKVNNVEDIINGYFHELDLYLSSILEVYSKIIFETDPILSLFSDSCLESRKDIANGGARYSNIGFTSVGLATVVDSIVCLDDLVFKNQKVTIAEINEMRKSNFENTEITVDELLNVFPRFGNDEKYIINLTNRILCYTSDVFERYRTMQGGRFKFGLSSPNYIIDASNTEAAFDGRKAFHPFSVHISSNSEITPIELFNFTSQLDFSGNRINGNVADVFIPSSFIEENFDKIFIAISTAINKGIYQIQMNIVSSKVLIAAKRHPDLYPHLVVRVWGFSAYFKDLPNEYKDFLIQRALVSERSFS